MEQQRSGFSPPLDEFGFTGRIICKKRLIKARKAHQTCIKSICSGRGLIKRETGDDIGLHQGVYGMYIKGDFEYFTVHRSDKQG